MKRSVRFLLVFAGAIIGGAFVHELGHALLGAVRGIAVVPTPLKEYVLREQIEWVEYCWISLGGVLGTTLLAAGALIWYARTRSPSKDAIFAGALLIPFAYTLRYVLLGRGHDGLEWQAAQSALGASAAGHLIDVVFLVLTLVGCATWAVRNRRSIRWSTLAALAGLAVAGIALLMAVQVANNMLFDRFLPNAQVLNIPPALLTHSP